MSRTPGADELRIRALLLAREVGPDAVPPKPTVRPRDWLDDIIDEPTPTEEEAPAEPEPDTAPVPAKAAKQKPGKQRPKKRKRPKPGAPRAAWDTRPPSPRQSLADAFDRIPPRLKWLAYHASAAYLGWSMGLVGWSTHVTEWIADTGPVGPQAFVCYALAFGTVLVYRQTRGWWTPVAWLTAAPVSSVVVGVLLYGTPHP